MEATLERPQETAEPAAVAVTVETLALKGALDRLAKLVPVRPATPLYAHLAPAPRPGALVLAGTNGERDLELTIEADATHGPTRLVPAAPLAQVVRTLDAKTVTLELEGETLVLTAGRFATRLHLAPDGEALPLDFTADPLLALSAADLAAALGPQGR